MQLYSNEQYWTSAIREDWTRGKLKVLVLSTSIDIVAPPSSHGDIALPCVTTRLTGRAAAAATLLHYSRRAPERVPGRLLPWQPTAYIIHHDMPS